MNQIDRIEALIGLTIAKCRSWLERDDKGLLQFVDPNDHIEISAHYGATHAAAAFIIWGIRSADDNLRQLGCELMSSILGRWEDIKRMPAFHNDFNNFALCVTYGYIDDIYPDLAERIKHTVLSTADSNNPTTNWLPMRSFVNKCRFEWTGKEQYESVVKSCEQAISAATNADGGIEDRMPKGVSFNLQYDVATVSVMQYISAHGGSCDIRRELGFLLRAVALDGDINYQGRGVNQIFAWSGWIYLLACSGQNEALNQALEYIEKRLPVMLENGNMMLNPWDGKEKYLWWDYHYSSVYTAHLLLWLVLALEDFAKHPIAPAEADGCSTGLRIIKTDELFGAVFEGRDEYLAEKGPLVAAFGTARQGMLIKGSFAPWQGLFGNHHVFDDAVIKNFCGLISVRKNFDLAKNRLMRRFLPMVQLEPWLRLKPAFLPVDILDCEEEIVIRWTNTCKEEMMINLPMIRTDVEMHFFVDGKQKDLSCVGSIRNQYDWIWIYQSRTFVGRTIELRIHK